ncbi:MAG: hypothetical protein D6726_10580 [Nitrospirae bacterium]|nr:MAG: hypothetical protein D6726_10580 [Nitrospirota bacterium]
MDFMNLFWLFFMVSALQPIIKQKLLESARQRQIAKIEKNRGSRVIMLIHRQETMSLLGFPILKYIDINDSEEVIRAIHMTDPDLPLDLILHTPGGLVLASYQIAHAIKLHPGKVTVFVPHYAMSGGTLIALAADEIVMGEHSVLGPVDPQIGQYPAASLLKILEQKPIEDVEDKTLLLADIGKKAIDQLRRQIEFLLKDRYPEEKASEIAKVLSEGRWTHDYPITATEARTIGLNVNTDMPEEVYQLMSLYRQPIRRQTTVEYLPVPRYKRETEGKPGNH